MKLNPICKVIFLTLAFSYLFFTNARQLHSEETTLNSFFGDNSNIDEDVFVKEVISPTYVKLSNDVKVKLIGLKIPSSFEKRATKVQRDSRGRVIESEVTIETPLKDLARNFVEELVKGKKVRLEFDILRKDDENANLVYMFLKENNLLVNEEIIKQGYANLQIAPPNIKYAKELRDAYQQAREEKRGLQGQ